MKKVLIICFNDLKRDIRVIRQINFLKDRYHLTTVSLVKPHAPDVEAYEVHKKEYTPLQKIKHALYLLFRKFDTVYEESIVADEVKKTLQEKDFDYIISNDVDTLPFACSLKKNANLIFDAHEYFPEMHKGDDKILSFLFHPYYNHLLKKYNNRIDRFITVSNGLADSYRSFLNRENIEVITNAVDHSRLTPSKVNSPIQLIHHGVAQKAKNIEQMFEVARLLGNDYHMNFLLMGTTAKSKAYLNLLKEKAANYKNITFLEPVTADKVTETINKYDIGIYLLKPKTKNQQYVLPNKLFTFVQARLAIAIGPSKDMADIVSRYSLGGVSKDFSPSTVAKMIKSWSKNDIEKFKENCDRQSFDLSSAKNKEKLSEIIKEL